jgi:hypothetical protein
LKSLSLAVWVALLTGCPPHFPEPYEEAPVGFPELPGEFLNSKEIRNQTSDLPDLVTVLLYPTLGAPARLDPNGDLTVFVDQEPDPRWQFFLVPRKALGFLEETDFVLPVPAPEKAKSVIDVGDRFSDRISLHKGNLSEIGSVVPGKDSDLPKVGDRTPPGEVITPDPRRNLPREKKLLNIPELPEGQRTLRRIIRRLGSKTRDVIGAGGNGVELNIKAMHPVDGILQGQEHYTPGSTKTHKLILSRNGKGAFEEGLYALVIQDRKRKRIVDLQFNAVYVKADDEKPFQFVVAGDFQWGMNDEVLKCVLRFVQVMNMRWVAGGEEKPEFAIIVGDLVDCNYGSRDTDISIFNYTYTKEYLQLWLAMVGLRMPCYCIPGNHDGYRYRNDMGGTQEDGLWCFRSTFGPLYYAFDRGGYRFLCLNSYDLPTVYRTARVMPFNIELHEWIVPRFNLLNWGGGMQSNQFRWLKTMLETPAEGEGKKGKSLMFLHQDPRGSYPALKKGESTMFDVKRHVPISLGLDQRNVIQYAPRWDQTEEIHVGYYSPIRLYDSCIRSKDWFEALMPPSSRGYPGWIRYQQGWHAPYAYVGDFNSPESFADLEYPLADPLDILQLIAEHEVRAIFKGHDNHFCQKMIRKGEFIIPPILSMYGKKERRERIRELYVRNEGGLAIYHVADIGDGDSEGHGYFLVRIDGEEILVRQIDHS